MNLPKTTFQFIFHFAREQWLKFTIFILISTIWAVNETFFPYFLKRIVDTLQNYHGEAVFAAVKDTLILLVCFWVFMEALQRSLGVLQIYTFPYFRASIRQSVYKYVKSHSHEYFASHFAGNLAKKLADLPNSCQQIMEIICLQFTTALMGSIVVLIMMWITKPLFAIIVFIWLCIHLGLTFWFLRAADVLWAKHSDSVSILSGKIVDVFTNMMNVRLFSRADFEAKYLQRFQKEEIKKAQKAMWLVERMRLGLGINGLFLIFGVTFGLVYSWSKHWITLGDFTQVSMQSFWLLGWIWFISFQLTLFIRERGVITDALSLIRKGHDLVDTIDAKPIKITAGRIEFQSVGFGYRPSRPVFKHLNVNISPGEKVGLVGFSGSGKSTFVNLILRFYDLQSGRIVIDNQNIANVTQESLRAQIAMIPQDPSLFHRTLMENIRYGRLNATDHEVIEAAKLAHCDEFINRLDEGYESLVGERGIKLSGGQRQRIAIARAILKDAPILILDEATSSLDSVTEKLIHESLEMLMRGRTTIVVAHRLSTLADMDRILVFDKGQVVEEGSKEDLLAKDGYFAKLWNMQIDGFLPE